MHEVLPIGIGIVANLFGIFSREELTGVNIVSAIEQERIEGFLFAINFNRYFVLVVRMVAMNKHYILATATAIWFEVRFVVFFLAVPTFIVCESDCPLEKLHSLCRIENIIPFVNESTDCAGAQMRPAKTSVE